MTVGGRADYTGMPDPNLKPASRNERHETDSKSIGYARPVRVFSTVRVSSSGIPTVLPKFRYDPLLTSSGPKSNLTNVIFFLELDCAPEISVRRVAHIIRSEE